jgi:hypothetical protein
MTVFLLFEAAGVVFVGVIAYLIKIELDREDRREAQARRDAVERFKRRHVPAIRRRPLPEKEP